MPQHPGIVATLVGPHRSVVVPDEATPDAVIEADCTFDDDAAPDDVIGADCEVADDTIPDDVTGADCVVVRGCEDPDVPVVESGPSTQGAVPTQTGTARLRTAEDSAERKKVQRSKIVVRSIISNVVESGPIES